MLSFCSAKSSIFFDPGDATKLIVQKKISAKLILKVQKKEIYVVICKKKKKR